MSTPTIGAELFGLRDGNEHAAAVDSIHRALAPLREKGPVPQGTTYHAIADAIVDTISGYSGEGNITPDLLPALLTDALDQLDEQQRETTSEGRD